MVLGSTHPLTEIEPGVFSGGKGDRCVRLTTLLPSCPVVMKSWNLNFLEPSGPLQAYSYMQRNLAVMCRFPAYPAYIRKLYKERTLFIRKLNFKKFSKGMSPILPTSPFSAFYLILVLNKQPSWARVHKSRGSGCHGAQAPNTVCPTRYRTSLIILPLMRILQRNLKRTTDTFLFISHTTNVLLFKFRCNIFDRETVV
jgi:hypothetical protein